MLNFRKLKQDFAPGVLKEGRALFDKKQVMGAKIEKLSPRAVRLSCRVQGAFENAYECELEVDRNQSSVVDSNCDCPYKYDCQHIAAVLFYLEENFGEIVLSYSKEADLDQADALDEEEKAHLRQTFKEVECKESARRGKKNQKELLQEYTRASQELGQSPFFLPEENLSMDKAELAVVVGPMTQSHDRPGHVEIHLALRLPYRSKPLNIPVIKEFFDAIRYNEPLYIGSKRYYFSFESFDAHAAQLLKHIMDHARIPECKEEKSLRTAYIETETFGGILAESYEMALSKETRVQRIGEKEDDAYTLPCFYCGTLEESLKFSMTPATLKIALEYLEAPAPKILLNPSIELGEETQIMLEGASLFECAKPGLFYANTYYRFQPKIRRKHLRTLNSMREVTIPEPLFGTFVENSLPELMRYAHVAHQEIIERFVTLPYVGQLQAECDIHYLNGELEATLWFLYGEIKVPASAGKISIEEICLFVTEEGILARNLTEEQMIIRDLFQDFIYDPQQGVYTAKSDKKIVEFMTEVIPRNQTRVTFNCPENLLEQFIYDESSFEIALRETDRIDMYSVKLKVSGHLNGTTVDQLWDCIASKRAFIELPHKKLVKKKGGEASQAVKANKILVLDLERLAPIVQIFDELGVNKLDDHVEERPLWSLANIDAGQFEGLPIKFTMTAKLKEIQQQMLGTREIETSEIPKSIQATLRTYQIDGIGWLERLRKMHLNGILADDMGLGKTLQAIIAVTQNKLMNKQAQSIVVCPTSLVYNWVEEFSKFNPNLKTLPVDGTPAQRKKLLNDIKKFDVVVTSYSLLQKDIDFYKEIPFSYAILDEAQHIKNRGTRNAKSVKMIQAKHRLILTGTPIENSLDELWSLFDFLMPGLLSSYDRFVEKYIRHVGQAKGKNLENLRRKVSPFILRRMKKDVLSDLPPVSDIVYHCHLSEMQKELYQSYAQSAREELSQLVKKEGFDRVQIHVLATLTRLKQICCHPAIFAKDRPELGDSAKYDMLMELLQNLMEARHKTVIFSQYTRMLNIMREDLQQQGIKFSYLDGSSKNRLEIVKKFNEDDSIPIFLVSLKAGGSGLNLTGADTVIHYDMWWNPAVENQATDRVHRIGQKNSVSSYKLVTLNTIEEKILELQKRKMGLVKKVVSCDEEAISMLTWEEVLELLQTW